MFYIHFNTVLQFVSNFVQIIGGEQNTYRRAAVDSGETDINSFGIHVDGASKLLIDSALFLELREGGVSCYYATKVFSWSRVTHCEDLKTPVLICRSRYPSWLHIIKIIPQPSTKSLFVTWPTWLSSVKSSPITVSGTIVYSEARSP